MSTVWRHIAQSVRGPSHAADSSPCQDSWAARVLGDGSSLTLVACAADGAGSAKHGDRGSEMACETVVARATAAFEANDGLDSFRAEDAVGWCEAARERIKDTAGESGCVARDFATTLCAAILTPRHSFFFQIGDGAIILRSHGVYGVVFWPQSGEYANSTNFLTSDDFRGHVEFLAAGGSFSDVAIFTDGLERLSLKFENQSPHPPFFEPLFRTLRSTGDCDELNDSLRRFLESDSVRARSDDDKTLILASRITGALDDAF